MADTTSTPKLIASTVASLPASAAERFGEHTVARRKADGEWTEITYAEAGEAIQELALGLIDLGIEAGDRVCLLSDTRWEWTLASYAISAAGGVVVPVYPTNSPHECERVAGDSGARAAVGGNGQHREKIDQRRGPL